MEDILPKLVHRVEVLEEMISAIESRNKRVDLEKRWEVSIERRIAIVLLTYCLMAGFLYLIGVTNFLTNALIPTLGYYVSTLSLGFYKKMWMVRSR